MFASDRHFANLGVYTSALKFQEVRKEDLCLSFKRCVAGKECDLLREKSSQGS